MTTNIGLITLTPLGIAVVAGPHLPSFVKEDATDRAVVGEMKPRLSQSRHQGHELRDGQRRHHSVAVNTRHLDARMIVSVSPCKSPVGRPHLIEE